jgi:hypothetical protein
LNSSSRDDAKSKTEDRKDIVVDVDNPASAATALSPEEFGASRHDSRRFTALDGQLSLGQYFSRNLFVHTHVEKTGGTAFVYGLRPILGEQHIYDLRGPFQRRPIEMSAKELRDIWLFSGHFWFDTQERAFARRKRYFVNIRDPIERFISFYNYISEAPSHPGYVKYGKLEIGAAYRYLRENKKNAIFNRMCAMYGERAPSASPREPGRVVRPRRPVTFEEAKAKIEQNYVLVIPFKRVDDAVRRIGTVLGVDVPVVQHVNLGPKKETILSDEIRQELAERNAEDYQLLAHFESVFDQHLADLPARLTS